MYVVVMCCCGNLILLVFYEICVYGFCFGLLYLGLVGLLFWVCGFSCGLYCAFG